MSATKRFDITESENPSKFDFKRAMIATALFIALNFNFLEIEDGILWTLTTNGLAIYIWWIFRQYFKDVGDDASARILTIAIAAIALFGMTKLFLQLFLTMLGTSAAGILLILAKINLIFALIALIAFFAVPFKLFMTNKHHALPLKRIALSSLLFVPLYLLIMTFSNMQMVQLLVGSFTSMSNLLYPPEIYTDGSNYYMDSIQLDQMAAREMMFGAVSGIFSILKFFWNLLVMTPYYFLFFHFRKLNRFPAAVEN